MTIKINVKRKEKRTGIHLNYCQRRNKTNDPETLKN